MTARMVKKNALGAALHLMFGFQAAMTPHLARLGIGRREGVRDSAYPSLKGAEPIDSSRLKFSKN